MALATHSTFRDLERTLPRSEIVYPSSFADRVKYRFWRLYTPFHPVLRDTAINLGLASHSGRQNFLIGKIAPSLALTDVVHFLVSCGYGNHFIAWKDDGEVVSLRRLDGFMYQYHIRIFADGEVRGHYEYTPECYPILHLKAVDQRDCRDEFLEILKGKIIPA